MRTTTLRLRSPIICVVLALGVVACTTRSPLPEQRPLSGLTATMESQDLLETLDRLRATERELEALTSRSEEIRQRHAAAERALETAVGPTPYLDEAVLEGLLPSGVVQVGVDEGVRVVEVGATGDAEVARALLERMERSPAPIAPVRLRVENEMIVLEGISPLPPASAEANGAELPEIPRLPREYDPENEALYEEALEVRRNIQDLLPAATELLALREETKTLEEAAESAEAVRTAQEAHLAEAARAILPLAPSRVDLRIWEGRIVVEGEGAEVTGLRRALSSSFDVEERHSDALGFYLVLDPRSGATALQP